MAAQNQRLGKAWHFLHRDQTATFLLIDRDAGKFRAVFTKLREKKEDGIWKETRDVDVKLDGDNVEIKCSTGGGAGHVTYYGRLEGKDVATGSKMTGFADGKPLGSSETWTAYILS